MDPELAVIFAGPQADRIVQTLDSPPEVAPVDRAWLWVWRRLVNLELLMPA